VVSSMGSPVRPSSWWPSVRPETAGSLPKIATSDTASSPPTARRSCSGRLQRPWSRRPRCTGAECHTAVGCYRFRDGRIAESRCTSSTRPLSAIGSPRGVSVKASGAGGSLVSIRTAHAAITPWFMVVRWAASSMAVPRPQSRQTPGSPTCEARTPQTCEAAQMRKPPVGVAQQARCQWAVNQCNRRPDHAPHEALVPAHCRKRHLPPVDTYQQVGVHER
jgi:hypothetical protein